MSNGKEVAIGTLELPFLRGQHVSRVEAKTNAVFVALNKTIWITDGDIVNRPDALSEQSVGEAELAHEIHLLLDHRTCSEVGGGLWGSEQRSGLQLFLVGLHRVAGCSGGNFDGLGLAGGQLLHRLIPGTTDGLGKLLPGTIWSVKHLAANYEQVEDLARNLRGIEDGVDALVGENLRDERLPGHHGGIRGVVEEGGDNVGVRCINEAEL